MHRRTPVRWAARGKSGLVRPAHLILRASLPPRSRLARPSAQPIPCPGIEPTASEENALELVTLRGSQFQKRNIEAWRNFMPSTVRQSGNGLQVRDKECLKFLYTGDQVVRDDDERMYSMMIMAEQIMHRNLWVATSLSISIL
jgi:hypothetical protein